MQIGDFFLLNTKKALGVPLLQSLEVRSGYPLQVYRQKMSVKLSIPIPNAKKVVPYQVSDTNVIPSHPRSLLYFFCRFVYFL